jgi:glutathione S-transferase
MSICGSLLGGPAVVVDEAITDSMHVVAREARTIEQRLSRSDWIVGDDYSAADMVIFPAIQLLRRALGRQGAEDLARRFLPLEANYPALGRWLARIEALPGYDRTYPPQWRAAEQRGSSAKTP